MKNICKNCKRRYKMLSEKELCVMCHKEIIGEFPGAFTSSEKSRREMKFEKRKDKLKPSKKAKKKKKVINKWKENYFI